MLFLACRYSFKKPKSLFKLSKIVKNAIGQSDFKILKSAVSQEQHLYLQDFFAC